MKSRSTIKRHLKDLDAILHESGQDPVAFRIAYAMKVAVQWVTESVVRSPSLADEAQFVAELLRRELKGQ
jgi:hypothetical protein